MDRGQRLPTAWLRPLGSGRGRSWCREGDDRERSLVLNLSVLLSHSEVWRVRVIGEDYTQPPGGDRFSEEDKSPWLRWRGWFRWRPSRRASGLRGHFLGFLTPVLTVRRLHP